MSMNKVWPFANPTETYSGAAGAVNFPIFTLQIKALESECERKTP